MSKEWNIYQCAKGSEDYSGILVGIFYLLAEYHLNAVQMALIFVISLAIQIIVFVAVYRTPDRRKR